MKSMLASWGSSRNWQPVALRFYRLAILMLIALLVRQHHVRLRIDGDLPITVPEVQSLLPEAMRLRPDPSPRAGLQVLDRRGETVGYVLRTAPISDHIIGYAGPTDTLVAFDRAGKVLGIQVRRSDDTRTHLGDVIADRHFMRTWNGMTWEQVAGLDLAKAGIEGVSGATKTSLAIAEGITYRLAHSQQGLAARPVWRIGLRDLGLALVVLGGLILSLGHLHGRRRLRRLFQVVVVVYVGLINGDLIAQSLLAGWAKSRIPWHAAPGLALLVTAAFVVPWVARRPLYCLHLCPHGALQEWLGRLSPRKLRLCADVERGLRWLPALLLAVILFLVMAAVPLDLADFEAFDAYLIRSAGWATLTIAALGLVAAVFVPQAYCKFGCPTGALLEFVRSHGRSDRFGRRDLAAALMVALAALVSWHYPALHGWLLGTP